MDAAQMCSKLKGCMYSCLGVRYHFSFMLKYFLNFKILVRSKHSD